MSALATEPGAVPKDAHSNRPENTLFKQQRLPAWQPVMSPPLVIGCLLITGIVFVILGAVIIVASDQIVEVQVRYDQVRACDFNERLPQYNYACDPFTMPLPIQKTLKAPVYLYYHLEHFYQNHRRYAKSRSDTQISGSDPSSSSMSDCDPFLHPGEYKDLSNVGTVQYDVGGPSANLKDAVYNPCGLVPWSMFNDSFRLLKNETNGRTTLICDGANFNISGNPIDVTTPMHCEKKGIAWESDPGVRFVAADSFSSDTITHRGWPGACGSNSSKYNSFLCNGWYMGEVGHSIPAAEDEDLMVWMRLASLSTFRKLYRRITTDLDAGSYSMEVSQRFDVRSFSGKKSFILATSNWLGGKNYFLGGLYIGVGAICVILGVAFGAKHLTTRRRITGV